MELPRLTPLRLVKIGQPLAPQLVQAGVAFSAVEQLPQDPQAGSEGLVALPTITIILQVEAYSGRHKSQPLEVGIREGAYSVTQEEEGSV